MPEGDDETNKDIVDQRNRRKNLRPYCRKGTQMTQDIEMTSLNMFKGCRTWKGRFKILDQQQKEKADQAEAMLGREGRIKDADAGVLGRRKTAFLPKNSLASLLRQSEISRNTVLGRRKDASPV
ncbi:hypothetical protein DPMN_037385 [Dreissena polymorpha]|uniref:Uncharacterized protein n=1 Tax=Dreissena polymorpha TaxID=45954 RepID=A0A9D4MCJ8_DREPO|nr:hypothetical protein DPMN_037385 [Dreissena polymorpha]